MGFRHSMKSTTIILLALRLVSSIPDLERNNNIAAAGDGRRIRRRLDSTTKSNEYNEGLEFPKERKTYQRRSSWKRRKAKINSSSSSRPHTMNSHLYHNFAPRKSSKREYKREKGPSSFIVPSPQPSILMPVLGKGSFGYAMSSKSGKGSKSSKRGKGSKKSIIWYRNYRSGHSNSERPIIDILGKTTPTNCQLVEKCLLTLNLDPAEDDIPILFSRKPNFEFPTNRPSVQSLTLSPSSNPSIVGTSLEPSQTPTKAPTSIPSTQPTCRPRSVTSVGIYSQPELNGAIGNPDCRTESENLLSIVEHFIKTDDKFADFSVDPSVTSFDDPDLAAKLDAFAFFFIPDIESSLTGWDNTSQQIMESFVESGGTLVMTGTNGSKDATFLNEIFPGWDLESVSCTTVPVDPVNSAGTPWEGGKELDCPIGADHLNCMSVSCIPIWGNSDSAGVAVLPYSRGNVIYLGYDYRLTGYGFEANCIYQDSEWVTNAFRGSLLYAKLISC